MKEKLDLKREFWEEENAGNGTPRMLAPIAGLFSWSEKKLQSCFRTTNIFNNRGCRHINGQGARVVNITYNNNYYNYPAGRGYTEHCENDTGEPPADREEREEKLPQAVESCFCEGVDAASVVEALRRLTDDPAWARNNKGEIAKRGWVVVEESLRRLGILRYTAGGDFVELVNYVMAEEDYLRNYDNIRIQRQLKTAPLEGWDALKNDPKMEISHTVEWFCRLRNAIFSLFSYGFEAGRGHYNVRAKFIKR